MIDIGASAAGVNVTFKIKINTIKINVSVRVGYRSTKPHWHSGIHSLNEYFQNETMYIIRWRACGLD